MNVAPELNSDISNYDGPFRIYDYTDNPNIASTIKKFTINLTVTNNKEYVLYNSGPVTANMPLANTSPDSDYYAKTTTPTGNPLQIYSDTFI